jgi:hypothetical protein
MLLGKKNATPEEQAQLLYELLMEHGLESKSVTFKNWSTKHDQWWIEAILYFGDLMYSLSTLTNSPTEQWQLQVAQTKVNGVSEEEFEKIRTELNRLPSFEAMVNKLTSIRKQWEKAQK